MELRGVTLRQMISVRQLCSVHYFEFSKHYRFPGESHDFWELVYVDKGEIIVTANDRDFPLRSGELLFHQPNEWHSIRANETVASNVMIVSFVSRSPAMTKLAMARTALDQEEKEILSRILTESRRVFSSRLDDPYDNELILSPDGPPGGQQMIGAYLSQLLISVYRRRETSDYRRKAAGSSPLLEEIRAYMTEHLSEKTSLRKLSEEFHVSPSYLKKLFFQHTGGGAIHYFLRLRTERAKELLRQSDKNVSQIAEALGYENVYYFSNQFRGIVGMSPMEYRKSLKALDEKGLRLLESG